jgi:DNA-binding IclR family transcriptional regulator
MRHGTVMSLRGTASGLLFAAHLPEAQVQAALDLEPEATPSPGLAEMQAELALIREAGLARAQDAVVAGVSALAAPVFDDQGRMVLSLTAIGPSRSFSLAADGLPARSLRRAAEDISRQLGSRASGSVST